MNSILSRSFLLAASVLLVNAWLSAKDWHVSEWRGNDSYVGSFGRPFKTITKALSVALANDRVLVMAGRYGPSSGEKFPLYVPVGVDVIGASARTCVIDAEFDPTRTTNPYTSSPVVQVFSKSRFAHFSLVNGPRDTKAPYFGHWWKIMLLVQDQTTNNAEDVEIDHLIFDEITRPLVVGYASGDHDVKNVRIHDCVISRFYSEGINSWVNNGTASGNLLYNCTVVGHMDTATNNPVPRDCILFGKNTQFDVRNCIVMQAQYAGIAVGTNTTVKSDYNCIWGGAKTSMPAYRGGLVGGANDLVRDPVIGAMPTAQQAVDPHLTPTSVARNSGLNQSGQTTQQDIDLGNPRVFAGRVDRGADEFLPLDAYFLDVPRLGGTIRLATIGAPQALMISALGFAQLNAGVTVPGFAGKLWLDPVQPILFGYHVKDARGYAAVGITIPKNNALRGLELDLQGIEWTTKTFGDLDTIRLIN